MTASNFSHFLFALNVAGGVCLLFVCVLLWGSYTVRMAVGMSIESAHEKICAGRIRSLVSGAASRSRAFIGGGHRRADRLVFRQP